MAHRKAGGTAKNLRDSQPKFLGVKLAHGELAQPGAIIIRQRGTRYLAGKNVGLGLDHTIFARKSGRVHFRQRRKILYNSKVRLAKEVSVF
ncbi:MAG: 50S ribosomal protein L27 [Candidatus Vogelbacteria bacterium]|nr:50S ribosomal protein L27 [Candidatus Vogelbacteria bacterium]